MGNLLNIIAVLLFISWVIGYWAFSLGAMVHLLLVAAFVSFMLRVIFGSWITK
jgi:hypothetical protein